MLEELTNRELGIKLDNLSKQELDRHEENKERLTKIEEKQDKTNGRISRLELWRMLLIGGYIILQSVIPILIYLILYDLNTLNKEVDYKIAQAIQANNDKYFEPLTNVTNATK